MSDPDTQTGTLLVVTPDRPDREVIQSALAAHSSHLYFALSGAQVLADAAEIGPDLVLLESQLPDMDGMQVLRGLKEIPELRDVPILMLVGVEDSLARNSLYRTGAEGYLVKPLDPDELQARVQTLLQLSLLRRQDSRNHRPPPATPPADDPASNQVINRLITALSIKQQPDDIMGSACQVLLLAFHMARVAAWTLDDTGNGFERVEACGPASAAATNGQANRRAQASIVPGDRLVIPETPWVNRLATEKRALVLADVLGDGQMLQDQEARQAAGAASCLIVPLLIQDQVRGFFELVPDAPRAFGQDELELAGSLATAVGEAMETARLYHRLQSYADFLDQALAQRTLELKGERYRTQSILEALGEAVVVTDLEGKIQYVNQAAVRLTGYTREELLSQRMRLWRSHRQTAELYTQMLNTLHTNTTWRGEVINERKDGSLYDAALTVAPYYDPRDNSTPIGFLSIQRDITPLKEAERLKDQFVSNVSHELRTPLSIVTLLVGNLDTLYDSLNDAKRRKLIHDIRAHIKGLNDLISSVLEISRIDGGRVTREYKRVDLAVTAREEASKHIPLAKSKYQTLHITGVDSLPVKGDDGQLRQVIRNLVNNAIKYTPKGGYITCECGEHPRDTAEAEGWPGASDLPARRWAALRVTDTGVGIPSQELPHLFERFYRVKSQGDIPGAGLGLSIAKELVHLHAGYIAVSSSPGEGSVFAIYLPLYEEG